jgi:hypothetical protein
MQQPRGAVKQPRDCNSPKKVFVPLSLCLVFKQGDFRKVPSYSQI